MIKIMSSNIRFNNPADKEHDWNGRRVLLSNVINSFSPDILGTQEGWEPQLKDLHSLLENYEISDKHRDWIEDRMYPTLFLKKGIFTIKESGDIWLSETPYVAASKSFDSAFPRLCTWLKATHINSNLDFMIIDTHLDHLETSTRQEQIKVLIKESKKINTTNLPIVLLGDFNESPFNGVREIIDNSNLGLTDAWLHFNQEEEASHHGFKGFRKDGTRIDWILTSKELVPQSIQLYKESEDGIYPSDHFPVISEFTIKA